MKGQYRLTSIVKDYLNNLDNLNTSMSKVITICYWQVDVWSSRSSIVELKMTKPLETQLTSVTRSASSPGRQSFGPFNMTDTHCRPDSCQKSRLSHIFKIDFMTWKWFSSSFISRHPVETLAELATHYLLFTGFLIPRHSRSCHLLIHSWF